MKEVYIAKQMRDRKFQRSLLQFFKPENYFEVREALSEAGRTDLIGDGCDSLISSHPPKEAIARRREDAGKRFSGEYYHAIKNKVGKRESRREPGKGYRPGEQGKG